MMKTGLGIVIGLVLGLGAGQVTLAQQATTQPGAWREISPGFKVRSNGVIDIGDLFMEVNYYDTSWTIAQQHDRFAPSRSLATAPTTEPGLFTVNGIFTVSSGPTNLNETVKAVEGGIDYSASLSSEKDLPTAELSVAFLLPTASFAGKQVMVDQQRVSLPAQPAKKDEPRIDEKEEVHQIELPTAAGTLTITGNFHYMVQDDRQWGDPRYSLRLYFTPGTGVFKESKIDLRLRLKAATTLKS